MAFGVIMNHSGDKTAPCFPSKGPMAVRSTILAINKGLLSGEVASRLWESKDSTDRYVQGKINRVYFLIFFTLRWIDPVLVEVFTYGLPLAHATLGDSLIQGLLKPIVAETASPATVLAADVYANMLTLLWLHWMVFIQPPPIGLPPTVPPVLLNLMMMPQGGEVVEDIPLPNWQTEQGMTSLWVLSIELMINIVSLPSKDFLFNDIFHLPSTRVCVQCTFEICQAEDTSVPRESVSTQDILSLYVRVPAQSSISQILVEELDSVHDVSDSITFAICLVMSEDDLWTMASAISFPPVNDLVPAY
ncbi:hypothetical protein F5146DRAFT_1004043 [Armillaria mellea]|nr:hypothetical protein F5146DRAFT_1004043 [Armillaria mellea]